MPWGQFKDEKEAYAFTDWLERACRRKGYNEAETLTRTIVFPSQLRQETPSKIALQLLERFRSTVK